MKGAAGATPVLNGQQSLFVLRNANMTLTTDQTFTKLFPGSKYIITGIFGKLVSGAFGVACLGGIYDTAAKGGNALIAATQTWATLTGVGTAQTGTLAAIALTIVSTATPILSLSTGNTGALSADIFIFGVCVD